MSSDDSIPTPDEGGRFLPLLIGLTLLITFAPILRQHALVHTVIYSIVLIVGIPAMGRHRMAVIATWAMLVLTLSLSWIDYSIARDTPGLAIFWRVVGALYFLLLLRVVMYRVMSRRQVDLDTIVGGVTAYFTIIVVFAMLHSLVHVINPEAYQFGDNFYTMHSKAGSPPVATFIYFSVITATTLGYGDVLPASPWAQCLATLEVLIGQLFVAIFIARLVGVLGRQQAS